MTACSIATQALTNNERRTTRCVTKKTEFCWRHAGLGEDMRRDELKREAQAWAMVAFWVSCIALATVAWHRMLI